MPIMWSRRYTLVQHGTQQGAFHNLNSQELIRYSRQMVLPELGTEGQSKLKSARVLVVGAGGLGSPALFYLAASGVGTLGLAEFDQVDLSNLQRQILYCTKDLGLPKAEIAATRLSALNDSIKVQAHPERVDASNIAELVGGYDLVLDGTDNISTRRLINGACLRLHKPYIYGAVYRWEGVSSVFACPGSPCYCCVYPEDPKDAIPDPAHAGIIGAVAGTIGTIQATEAIKFIVTGSSSLTGKLLVYDGMQMRFDSFSLQRNPDCPACQSF